MVRHRAGIFANQVRHKLLNRRGNGLGAAFDDRLAQPGDARVGMDFQEEPAGLDEHRFDFRNLEFVAHPNHRLGILAANLALVLFQLFQVILTGFAARLGATKAPGGGRSARHAEGAGKKRAPVQGPFVE